MYVCILKCHLLLLKSTFYSGCIIRTLISESPTVCGVSEIQIRPYGLQKDNTV